MLKNQLHFKSIKIMSYSARKIGRSTAFVEKRRTPDLGDATQAIMSSSGDYFARHMFGQIDANISYFSCDREKDSMPTENQMKGISKYGRRWIKACVLVERCEMKMPYFQTKKYVGSPCDPNGFRPFTASNRIRHTCNTVST